MALNSLFCADVPLRNYSHSLTLAVRLVFQSDCTRRKSLWPGFSL